MFGMDYCRCRVTAWTAILSPPKQLLAAYVAYGYSGLLKLDSSVARLCRLRAFALSRGEVERAVRVIVGQFCDHRRVRVWNCAQHD